MNIKTAMDRDTDMDMDMDIVHVHVRVTVHGCLYVVLVNLCVCHGHGHGHTQQYMSMSRCIAIDMDIHNSPCPCPYLQLLFKKENILYIITSLLQFQNIHTLYTISHITNNLWAQEWRQKHLLLRNPRGWPFKIKKKVECSERPNSREQWRTCSLSPQGLCNILYVLHLGMVHSRNGPSRYCPFQELSVLGMVTLGIVASRNGHVRNCRIQEWSCQELSRLGMVVLGIVTSRNGRVRNCRVQEWSFQEWSRQEWSFQDLSFQDWYKYCGGSLVVTLDCKPAVPRSNLTISLAFSRLCKSLEGMPQGWFFTIGS